MSGVSNLKPLVNARVIIQNNNQVCTQYAFNTNTFTSITVSTTPAGANPSGGSLGDYGIRTSNNTLWVNTDGTSWALVTSSFVVVSCPSNATYNNKAYSTDGSGILSSVNSATIRTSTKGYTTNGSGSVTVLSSGRYLNTTPNPEQVYDVAVDVTDGTYTTLSFNNGKILTTNSACWCLVNSNWVQLS